MTDHKKGFFVMSLYITISVPLSWPEVKTIELPDTINLEGAINIPPDITLLWTSGVNPVQVNIVWFADAIYDWGWYIKVDVTLEKGAHIEVPFP